MRTAKATSMSSSARASGSCSEADASFDPASGGCHFLISSGTSDDESYLVDASADGRDVFFSTREQLVGWDVERQLRRL